jgi:hypothetical protein
VPPACRQSKGQLVVAFCRALGTDGRFHLYEIYQDLDAFKDL